MDDRDFSQYYRRYDSKGVRFIKPKLRYIQGWQVKSLQHIGWSAYKRFNDWTAIEFSYSKVFNLYTVKRANINARAYEYDSFKEAKEKMKFLIESRN